MNTQMKNTIDLMPYLPVYECRKHTDLFSHIIRTVGLVIEGAVTLGIGLCLMAGLYIFLTIV